MDSAMDSIESLITRCLANQMTEGACGPEDPWNGVSFLDSEPEKMWLFITGFVRRADTPEQFEKITAGPLSHFWTEHQEAFLSRLRDVAAELPQLVNLVVAEERRIARSVDLMNVIYILAHPERRSEIARSFEYTPRPELAELVQPGRHPMTESLLVPNESSFMPRRSRSPVTEEELNDIVEGYIRSPSPPEDDDEDDWGWALEDLVRDFPMQAWTAILRIIAREHDGVDIGLLGAGALETLMVYRAEELLSEIEIELGRNPDFVRALTISYLYDMSEAALSRLAGKGRELLAAV